MTTDRRRYASYAICTSPRSGSTLLCRLLKATGVAGAPASLFHQPSLDDWLDDYGLSDAAFASENAALVAVFAAAIERGRGGTPVFGVRLQRHSFPFFARQLATLHPSAATDLERIDAAFGPTLFIHLTRKDKVDQAISLVKAEQSGLWHRAPDGTEIERLAPPREPVYDADAIRAALRTLTRDDAEWTDWFQAQGVEPLRIDYDALAENPRSAVRAILERLGVDSAAATDVAPSTAKLADASSRAWAARFRAETANDHP